MPPDLVTKESDLCFGQEKMQGSSRTKLVRDVWLPEDEASLVDMMLHNRQGTVFREGKATYQIHTLDVCLA